ncbi:hypothetical protein [Streptomyces sp. NPDC050538]|uniref:hypothetical protein n=1 Tax=Streptomyces sp. NPDC050538 TaxID=3365627 RepID=UPI00379F5388
MHFDEIWRIIEGSDPNLLLGWREASGSKELQARRAVLDSKTFEDLVGVCRGIVGQMCSPGYEEIPYHAHWHVDRERTYSRIALDEIPQRPATEEEGSELVPSRLLGLMENANDLSLLAKQDIEKTNLLFFAITFRRRGRRVAFVRKTDPKRALKKGLIQLRFVPKLTTVRNPDLVLEEVVDLIVTNDEVYVLSSQAYEQLLSDVPVAAHEVPIYLASVERELGAGIPLAADSRTALEKVCQSRPSAAKRLRELPNRLQKIQLDSGEKLDAAKLEKIIKRHKPQISLVDGGGLAFGEDGVNDFFDLLEGRWFTDDLGRREKRRALKYNLRP